MVFGLDSNFSEAAMIARINADLANNLGNLVSRTLNMTERYAGGQVPECGPLERIEEEVANGAAGAAEKLDNFMRRCEPQRALDALFEFVDQVNRYLEIRAPWKAAKQPGLERQVATTLYTSCEALRCIGLLLAPFLPETAAKILERLGLAGSLASARLPDDVCRFGTLQAGTKTTVGAPLFPRIEPMGENGS
jgi:methionyl-tRNA synthetase